MSKKIVESFCLGFFCALSCVALMQDWMGLSGYIEHIKANWWHIHWARWIPCIAYCLYKFRLNVKISYMIDQLTVRR